MIIVFYRIAFAIRIRYFGVAITNQNQQNKLFRLKAKIQYCKINEFFGCFSIAFTQCSTEIYFGNRWPSPTLKRKKEHSFWMGKLIIFFLPQKIVTRNKGKIKNKNDVIALNIVFIGTVRDFDENLSSIGMSTKQKRRRIRTKKKKKKY